MALQPRRSSTRPESYAASEDERLVGRALAPIRDQVAIATKFRVGDSASGAEVGRQIRARLEASLTRLGPDYLELYYQHRDDVCRVITRYTPAQVSLAWMLHKKPFIVPIPGSRKLERIQENLGAADINLSDEEFGRIEAELAKIEIHGNRTDEGIAKLGDLH